MRDEKKLSKRLSAKQLCKQTPPLHDVTLFLFQLASLLQVTSFYLYYYYFYMFQALVIFW